MCIIVGKLCVVEATRTIFWKIMIIYLQWQMDRHLNIIRARVSSRGVLQIMPLRTAWQSSQIFNSRVPDQFVRVKTHLPLCILKHAHYIIVACIYIYIINIRDDSDFNGFTRWTFANMNNEYNIFVKPTRLFVCSYRCHNGNSAIETNSN